MDKFLFIFGVLLLFMVREYYIVHVHVEKNKIAALKVQITNIWMKIMRNVVWHRLFEQLSK